MPESIDELITVLMRNAQERGIPSPVHYCSVCGRLASASAMPWNAGYRVTEHCNGEHILRFGVCKRCADDFTRYGTE